MKTVINKNMKSIIIVSAAAAILLGGLLILISGNEEPEPGGVNVETITAEIRETQTAETSETTETKVMIKQEKGNPKQAARLFAAKTESMGNGEAIAKLAETIGLEERIAPYTMELQEKKTPKTITVTFDITVKEEQRSRFDKKVQRCAEIMLALVEDAECIEWSYRAQNSAKQAEQVTVFLKSADASKLLNGDIKSYGRSEETVRKLLVDSRV